MVERSEMNEDTYNATMNWRTELDPDLVIIRVRSDGPLLSFRAATLFWG